MEKTIKVTGIGTASVRPDTTVITLRMSKVKRSYEDALASSVADVTSVKDMLEGLGLDREGLRTGSFGVDAKYDNTTEKDGSTHRTFKGYEYRQVLSFKFLSDNEILGKVLYALAHSKVESEFDIRYTVSDPKAAKEQVLSDAVKDAKKKAKTISTAAGIKLGNIAAIEYSSSEPSFDTAPVRGLARCMTMGSGNSYDIDIEPDDVRISDSVTVIWTIG